jgi:hypothetical protein
MDANFKSEVQDDFCSLSGKITALGAAPGSSYRRCPDAGSLKFPQTPLLVRFASAWRGPSERRFFCQKSPVAALAQASLPLRLRNYALTIGWHYGRSVVVCNADNETGEDEPDDRRKNDDVNTEDFRS